MGIIISVDNATEKGALMYEDLKKISAGRRIHLLFRLSMMYIRKETGKIGFGAGDYAFLAYLFTQDGISQDELSRNMRVDKSLTARVLAKLEKEGYVERKPDPEAYRVKKVFVGPKAREIEPDFMVILKHWNSVLLKDIPEERQAQFLSDLDTMIQNAEKALGLASVE